MAARPRERRMNVEEALAEIFADRVSDVSDFSDSEFEANVSEESEEEEEDNEGEEDEGGEANIEDDELENAGGPVRGNLCQDYEGRARTPVGSKVDISRSRSTDSAVHSYTRNPGSIA